MTNIKDMQVYGVIVLYILMLKSTVICSFKDRSPDLRKFGEEFYLREAKLWRPFRICGVISIVIAMPLMIIAILNRYWIYGEAFNAGIWECINDVHSNSSNCPETKPHWQNAVIGLMVFSTSFGFIAAVLAICGVCTPPLPKKIYYFHSAGEIFLVCAISAGAALIIYPVYIETDDRIGSHTYGSGYGLGWGGAFFFLTAAFCMSLDELVRESSKAKCCKLCFKQKNDEQAASQQV